MVGVVITVGEAKMKMKKYLKVIAILFISFGLTACANPDAWAIFLLFAFLVLINFLKVFLINPRRNEYAN